MPVNFNDPCPVHSWFGLSYAEFLTLPRLVMQSMPVGWQQRMVMLLEEMDEEFDWYPEEGCYWVRLRRGGEFFPPPLADYKHGRVEHLRRKK